MADRICPVCGQVFISRNSTARYCSKFCSARARADRQAEAIRAEIAALAGTRKGQCTVIGPADPDPHRNRSRILLRCDCETEFAALYTVWKQRGIPSMCRKCGRRTRQLPRRDRTGEQIGELTILGMESMWRGETYTKYLVRCKRCGGESVMDGKHLKTNRICARCAKENLGAGRELVNAAMVGGTNMIHLRGILDESRRVNKNSASGVTGVNRCGNKWRAVIVFRRKQYYLGTFDRIEDAAAARREAEEYLYGDFLAWYTETTARPEHDEANKKEP